MSSPYSPNFQTLPLKSALKKRASQPELVSLPNRDRSPDLISTTATTGRLPPTTSATPPTPQTPLSRPAGVSGACLAGHDRSPQPTASPAASGGVVLPASATASPSAGYLASPSLHNHVVGFGVGLSASASASPAAVGPSTFTASIQASSGPLSGFATAAAAATSYDYSATPSGSATPAFSHSPTRSACSPAKALSPHQSPAMQPYYSGMPTAHSQHPQQHQQPPPPPPRPQVHPQGMGMPPSPRIPLAPLGQQPGGMPAGGAYGQPYRTAVPSARLRQEDTIAGASSMSARRYSIDPKPPSPYTHMIQPNMQTLQSQANGGVSVQPPNLLPSQAHLGLNPGMPSAHGRAQSADVTGAMRRMSIGYPPSPMEGTRPMPPSPRTHPYGVAQSPRTHPYPVPQSPRAYPRSPQVGVMVPQIGAPSPRIGMPSPHMGTMVPAQQMAGNVPPEYGYGAPAAPVAPTAPAAPAPSQFEYGYPDRYLQPAQQYQQRPRSQSATGVPPHYQSALMQQQTTPAMQTYSRPPSPPQKRVIVISALIETAANEIAHQLARSSPDWGVLMRRLPTLSDDQVNELRAAYRKMSVVQSQGSLPKHIKAKVPGPLGRAFYATALGRHESELYWLTVWGLAQSTNGVRVDADIRSAELVIEAILGRSPDDIEMIQESYVDRKSDINLLEFLLTHFRNTAQYHPYQNPEQYGHHRLPLPESALGAAISIALTAERQDETEDWPESDVTTDRDALRRALAEKDHHMMLRIILTRSNRHLRLVLRQYEHLMNRNFAQDALDAAEGQMMKELVAHVLNGAMNKPAREALYLNSGIIAVRRAVARSRSASRHHAPRDSHGTQVSRAPIDVLTSRIVRLHWDRPLLAKVKVEYKRTFDRSVEAHLRDAMGGELGDYLLMLLKTDEDAVDSKPDRGGLSPSMGNSGQRRGRRGSFF